MKSSRAGRPGLRSGRFAGSWILGPSRMSDARPSTGRKRLWCDGGQGSVTSGPTPTGGSLPSSASQAGHWSDGSLALLRGKKYLKSVMIQHAGISDAGLAHLSAPTNLQTLYVTSCAVSDAGLVNLERLTNLDCLVLSRTTITDAGLRHLVPLPRSSKHWPLTSPESPTRASRN